MHKLQNTAHIAVLLHRKTAVLCGFGAVRKGIYLLNLSTMTEENRKAWNKDRDIGPKPPLSPQQVQTIRNLLSGSGELRDLVLFELAIDTSFRGADLVKLTVSQVMLSDEVIEVISLRPSKTRERTKTKSKAGIAHGQLKEGTRALLKEYISATGKTGDDYLFTKSKGAGDGHITPHHYRRLVKGWLVRAELDPEKYASHSLRRVRPALIYRETGNIRAVQKILGHSSVENTARYLGVEEAEAIEIAKRFEI